MNRLLSRRLILTSLLVCVPMLGASTAGARENAPSRYRVTDLGTLGGAESEAWALNERGDVAGWAQNAAGGRRAFLFRDGKMSDLGVLPGHGSSEAYGVNDQGQVAGVSITEKPLAAVDTARSAGSVGVRRAVLWSEGKALDLGPGEARDVNNRGQVAGHPASGPGFVWQEGKGRRELEAGTPGRVLQAWALNDAGTVAGTLAIPAASRPWGVRPLSPFVQAAGDGKLEILLPNTALPGDATAFALNAKGDAVGVDPHLDGVAFLWKNGVYTRLGTMNGPVTVGFGGHAGFHHSTAFGINDRGQVVGWANASDRGMNDLRAILWQGGALLDLNQRIDGGAGWTLEAARAINNRGQICGVGKTGGKRHAFLLTPAP